MTKNKRFLTIIIFLFNSLLVLIFRCLRYEDNNFDKYYYRFLYSLKVLFFFDQEINNINHNNLFSNNNNIYYYYLPFNFEKHLFYENLLLQLLLYLQTSL